MYSIGIWTTYRYVCTSRMKQGLSVGLCKKAGLRVIHSATLKMGDSSLSSVWAAITHLFVFGRRTVGPLLRRYEIVPSFGSKVSSIVHRILFVFLKCRIFREVCGLSVRSCLSCGGFGLPRSRNRLAQQLGKG